jgi:hypothetical protein
MGQLGLRKHLEKDYVDVPECGKGAAKKDSEACPSNCSCIHIHKKGNKMGRFNK